MSKIIKFASIEPRPFVVAHLSQEAAGGVACKAAAASLDVNPQKLIAQAQEKVEEMIAEAERRAAAILAEANAQAASIKQAAYDEACTQGYQDGWNDGCQSAEREMKQALETAAAQAAEITAGAQRQARELVLDSERQIIEIALAVARKILMREIDTNPMTILPIVRSALEKVRDEEQITIRVHPEDYDAVLQALAELKASTGNARAFTVVADVGIGPGGCFIDTANGTVDARIDSQMEEIKQAIQEVMP